MSEHKAWASPPVAKYPAGVNTRTTMKDGFKLPVIGVTAIAAMFFLGQIPNAHAREETRLKRENPGLQRAATDYYSRKYHVSRGEARRRIAIQDRAAGIDDDLMKILGDQFAGMWYDHGDRGRLKVGMTRGAMTKEREVRSVLRRFGVGGHADLVPVQFSVAELEQKQDGVRDSIMDMIRRAHAATSYDTKVNRVVVTALAKLPPEEDALVKRLSAREDVIVRRVDVPTLLAALDTCNVTFCNAPLRGGRAMDSSQGGICTAAFMARHRQTGDLLAMTAGHCIFFSNNDSWNARDEANQLSLIGPSYGFVFSGAPGGDEGVVKINPAASWFTPSPMPAVVVKTSVTGYQTAYDPQYAISQDSWSSMGQILCRTGRSTGTHCAEVSALGADESSTLFNPDGSHGPVFLLQHMGELDMCFVQAGDSGSPVYKSHRAFGILNGGVSNQPWQCHENYQGIRGAEGALGVDVLFQP